MADSITTKWIKTAADERAAANGCRFDPKLGEHVIKFFRKYLRHSKGEWAGRAFDPLEWQIEDLLMPLFSWVRADGLRRFNRAYVELPKKNGKSTLASGIGLYMLLGDGEAGAECYSVATDQAQASIVHGEAINMVEASPELSSVLTINRTTKNIHHEATRSFYRSLSSEAGSKEGINAHFLCADELHAWYGDQLWRTLRYASASRRQPLSFAITTAGSNTQSVCRQQHEYARGVLDGTLQDDGYFALIKAADPDDDWTSPAVWKKANPSLGHTLTVDEFQAAVNEAKQSPSNEASFKRYRLDIWQSADNPWLRLDDWMACKQVYTEADLHGRDCWAGLDLGRTRDTTALVLAFPMDDETIRLLSYFWLPEETARRQNHLVPYVSWARGGFIELTPGEVTDFTFVRKRIVELSEVFNIRNVSYDPYAAEDLMQKLELEDGLHREAFAQTVTNFALPTATFERLVISRKLHHNGHPVLAWQAGNAVVRSDANGNKRPVKHTPDDHRKIDGIVAGIMALAKASNPEPEDDNAPQLIVLGSRQWHETVGKQ